MKHVLLTMLLAIAVGACTPPAKDEAPRTPQAVTPSAEAGVPVIAGSVSYNIGDVEQTVRLQGTLAEESKGPNVELKELVNPNNAINVATVTVSAPYPEHLWLVFSVKVDGTGPDHPVALRGEILLGEGEDKSIEKFRGVAFQRNNIETTKVDLMAHLEKVPESILIVSKAEAILMPPGTAPATVDPATATGPLDSTTMLLSNPVRVNFKPAAGTP